MAEVVGLTLAVLALTGTFKDCVDLFSLVSAGRSFGRDSQILITKLDIEKTLLLQWGMKMGIGGDEIDPRLNDKRTSSVVQEVLNCIRLLLSDSAKLEERYGLKPEKDLLIESSSTLISASRAETFEEQYVSFKSRIRGSQLRSTTLAKTRWVIKDREKFQGLIDDISHFNSKLRELVPISKAAWLSLAEEDVARVAVDPHYLDMLRSIVLPSNGPFTGALDFKITEDRVLRCLWFLNMRDRQDDISEVHAHTFEWIHDLPGLNAMWDDFVAWTRSETGVYWVSGKAGSGKSTLMKYVYEHPKTRELLDTWAGESSLTVGSFFFWHLGGLEQKSQEGLMRTLLHDILDKNRSYIPHLLPAIWKAALQAKTDSWSPEPPSPTQLRLAFSKLADVVQPTTKMCFFIDGLDEYEGDHREGAAFVKSLTRIPNIKVVVSSRPISACFEAFGGCPGLRVHELTSGDIENYVNETISSHIAMQDLLNANPLEAGRLVSEVVSKASGVFLWVVLACRSLLKGFASYDGLSDLQQRIDDLPPELESLFQHMLLKIEPRYQAYAAKVLRLCTQSQLVSGTMPLLTLTLAVALDEDANWVSRRDLGPAPVELHRIKCQEIEGRLRDRCWGLVEVKRLSVVLSNDDTILNCLCHNDTVRHDRLLDSQIQFLHRTVLEFLTRPEQGGIKYLRLAETEFDASATLARAALYLVKTNEPPSSEQRPMRAVLCSRRFSVLAKDVFLYLLHANSSAKESIVSVVEDLQKVVTWYKAKVSNSLPDDDDDLVRKVPGNLDIFCVEIGLVGYVETWLAMGAYLSGADRKGKRWDGGISDTTFPALYYALIRKHVPRSWNLDISPATIRLLLSYDADPNEHFKIFGPEKPSPWQCYLPMVDTSDLKAARLSHDIISLFLEYNADPNAIGWDINSTEGAELQVEASIRHHFLHNPIKVRPKGWTYIVTMGESLISLLQEKQANVGGIAHPPVPIRPRSSIDEHAHRGEI